MKIAILSFFSGLNDRGVETWASDLAGHLSGEFDVNIISGKKNEGLLRNVLRTFNVWSRADVIVPTNGRIQIFTCRIVSWLKGKPIVVFGHSGPGADDKWNLLCSPNVFVAFSNYQKHWAERHKLPWTKVVKISHAVDTDMFTPAVKKPRNKLVLCVAADNPSKRVDLVRKACSEAGFNFLAVGKGQEKEAPHGQMPKIYKEVDIFCFVPETWEAFGLVFLEALSSNLPVVTVDDPVRREIVNHAGVFVKDPENIEHLASAIEIAYKMKWGSRPRVQAEKFSWEKIEKKYIQFFNDLNHQ